MTIRIRKIRIKSVFVLGRQTFNAYAKSVIIPVSRASNAGTLDRVLGLNKQAGIRAFSIGNVRVSRKRAHRHLLGSLFTARNRHVHVSAALAVIRITRRSISIGS